MIGGANLRASYAQCGIGWVPIGRFVSTERRWAKLRKYMPVYTYAEAGDIWDKMSLSYADHEGVVGPESCLSPLMQRLRYAACCGILSQASLPGNPR